LHPDSFIPAFVREKASVQPAVVRYKSGAEDLLTQDCRLTTIDHSCQAGLLALPIFASLPIRFRTVACSRQRRSLCVTRAGITAAGPLLTGAKSFWPSQDSLLSPWHLTRYC